LVDAAAMIFQMVEIFSYRTYTKEVPEWRARDYFMIEDMAPKRDGGWERRFIS